MAYIVMAYEQWLLPSGMARSPCCVVMTYIVMSYIVMAYVVMASIVMARSPCLPASVVTPQARNSATVRTILLSHKIP